MIPDCVSMFDTEGILIEDISDIDACTLLVINDPDEANKYFKSIGPLYGQSGVPYNIPEFKEMAIYGSWNEADGAYGFADITLYFSVLSDIMKNYPNSFINGGDKNDS